MKQAKAELEEFGCLSKYGYKAGVHLQHKSMDFRSPFLESLIKDRNKEMTNKISVKGTMLLNFVIMKFRSITVYLILVHSMNSTRVVGVALMNWWK